MFDLPLPCTNYRGPTTATSSGLASLFGCGPIRHTSGARCVCARCTVLRRVVYAQQGALSRFPPALHGAYNQYPSQASAYVYCHGQRSLGSGPSTSTFDETRRTNPYQPLHACQRSNSQLITQPMRRSHSATRQCALASVLCRRCRTRHRSDPFQSKR
jgi:hypothetical protein